MIGLSFIEFAIKLCQSLLHSEVIGINDDGQSRLGACAPYSICLHLHSELLADPLFAASHTRSIRHKPHRVLVKTAPTQVSPDELLMAAVLD
jgi:hypothetical protein